MGFNLEEIQDLTNSSCNCVPKFKTISFKYDVLNCVFIDPDGQNHEIQANVWDNNSSVWFTNSENKDVIEVVSCLTETPLSNIKDEIVFLKNQLLIKFNPPAIQTIPKTFNFSNQRLINDLVEVSKEPNIEMELKYIDGSLYNWSVKMKQFQPDSNLAKDLVRRCKDNLSNGLHYIEVRCLKCFGPFFG